MKTDLVKEGDFVRFYDCQKATKDKDFSGEDKKYYPIEKVLRVYEYISSLGYVDEVCDIQIGERISRAHFTRGVEIIKT